MEEHTLTEVSIDGQANGQGLTIEKVIAVVKNSAKVMITADAQTLLVNTSKALQDYVEQEAIPAANRIGGEIKTLNDELGCLDPVNQAEEYQRKQKELDDKQIELKIKMIYGVTTGFGALKTAYCETNEAAKELQKKIVISHTCGVGPYFDEETTRAIMLLRANNLTSGHCGIRYEVVQRLVDLLNADILPLIPEQGSVGASGDLAPLAHLALGLIGEGPVKYGIENEGSKDSKEYEKFDTLAQLKDQHPGVGIEPATIDLSYKEGLALINGITVMTGIGVLAYWDAENLVGWADALGAMTLESIRGASRAFDEIIYETVYHHSGAKKSAEQVRKMIANSEVINNSAEIHDPYSLRCIPQVHGAVRDALDYVKTTLDGQLNTVDDDPILFSEEDMAAHKPPLDTWKERRHFEQGNFHGEPIAFAMDMLAIVLSEIGNISERRIQMLLDKNHNRGLPSCLVSNKHNNNSGYMIAQYTAAALVSENKVLSHPASVDSIPTSANTEDHVSMGTIAARKARKVIENVKNILAIELLCATEALSYRQGFQETYNPDTQRQEKINGTGKVGLGTKKIYDEVREKNKEIFPLLAGEDKKIHLLINEARKFLDNNRLKEFIEL